MKYKTTLRRAIESFLIVSFCIASIQNAAAQHALVKKCVKHACFKPQENINEQALTLRGVALYEYFLVDVYAAALYLPSDISSEAVLDNVPRQLVLQYFRALKRENFIESGEHLMKKDPAFNKELIKKELSQLYALLEDVNPGDRYTLTYIPEIGTELKLNNSIKGIVAGEAFAKAYFGIWLSEKFSADKEFTEHLLDKKT
jgi:hypothetical protein